jgi:uncharacterized integral membrane protein
MARRLRTTPRVRDDKAVPRRNRNLNAVVIVIVIVLIAVFLLRRTQQASLRYSPPVTARPR